MNRTKLYVSAALFLFITVFKLAMPTAATDLREKLLPVISESTDYTKVLTEVGMRLTESGEAVAVTAEDGQAQVLPQPLITPITEYIAQTYPEVPATPTPAAEETPVTPAPKPNEPETPDVVAAFLESQAPYAGYAVPETVSYAMPALPFAHTSPVTGMTSSGFGYRDHPIAGEVKFHYGTDFAAWTGTAIAAFADGFVQAAGNSDSYGLYLILNHGNGWRTLYAHCSELCITEGSAVSMGQQIALAGETGQATGPHLHFELTCNNIYYNPEFYINA